MSAKCHFLNASPSYYDQTNTLKAINILELFISIYPNSENVLEANNLISKLNLILEEKAYNIAHSYYKTGKYNASIYLFNNFIESYPNSSFLEKVFYYQTKSFFELAKNSVEEKGITDKRVYICIPRFYLTYPESKFITELKKLER